MSGCMASARDRRRSIGQRYHAKAMPHAMRLNAMLIWNKASEGMILAVKAGNNVGIGTWLT
jgi:hypothetical protein